MKRLFDIILIGVLFNIALANAAEKLFKSANNNEYYIEPQNKYTWQESFEECKKYNKDLLTIDTPEKSQEIKELLTKAFTGRSIPRMYIGANDLKEFRKFSWVVSGEPLTKYENWEKQEPNNYQQLNERCVHIGFHGTDQWNDVNCERKYGFICQEKYDFAKLRAEVSLT